MNWQLGRFAESVAALERAVAIHRASDDPRAEAGSLNNLGLALREAGRADEAADALRRAVTLYRTLGDEGNAAGASRNLEAAPERGAST